MITAIFNSLKNIPPETKEEWLNIIDILDRKLSTVNYSIPLAKPLMIAHHILEKEAALLE